MIELTDIAYVRSGTADATEAVRFATEVVGMQYMGAEDGVHYLRADKRHHCLAFVEGRSGVISSAFSVADEAALRRAEKELAFAGVEVRRGTTEEARSRRVGAFITFSDPWGNRFDLVRDQVMDARPIAYSRPAGIMEFGHMCVDAPDVSEAYEWWSKHFNVRITDWIGAGAALTRIDEVHHKFAIFRGDQPGLCHMNFQVESIDDVMRSWHFLEREGVEIEFGPGKHPTSTAVFIYFKGPEGLTYEYSFGVQLIDDATWLPRYFDPTIVESLDMWGGPAKRPSTLPQLPADGGAALVSASRVDF